MVKVIVFCALFLFTVFAVQAFFGPPHHYIPRDELNCTSGRRCGNILADWVNQTITEKCPPSRRAACSPLDTCCTGPGCDCDYIVQNCC
uniref:Uncharacterized protein n=1 Tax=Panagrolaimus sp. PS1159 TaxID=55785 RepID=A0AC35FFF4_9BILA